MMSKHIAALLAQVDQEAAQSQTASPARLPTSKSNLKSVGVAAKMDAAMSRLTLDTNAVPRVQTAKHEREQVMKTEAGDRKRSSDGNGLHLTSEERRTTT
jgi:hypothetical protein